MTRENQPHESAAINLLNDQLNKLAVVRHLDLNNPQFISWRDTTTSLFQKFLRPDFPHFITFRDLRFRGPIQAGRRLPYGYRGPMASKSISPADTANFRKGSAVAEECIKGAIEEIRNFGVHSETTEAKAPQKTRGFHQNFHAPVTIHHQAIATGNAIQNIGQMGSVGAKVSLTEIAALLQESMELRGRETQEGLKAIEEIASEIQKPQESRNWKSIFDYGERVVGIANKATDLAAKIAPHLPTVTLLIQEAGKRLHGG